MTGINMDDYETTSGSIASDVYDSYNVPEGIFHHKHIIMILDSQNVS